MQSLLIIALWLAAATCRAGMIGVAPLLPQMQADLHLSYSQAQTVFALPVVVMGVLSIPGGMMADRIGGRRSVFIGLLLVLCGETLRATAHSFLGLGLWTLVFGAGIGIIQPSLPKLTRDLFAGRTQTITGIYTSGFVAGATIGASLTSPLLSGAFGWRGAMMFWGLFAALPALIWLPLIPRAPATPREPAAFGPSAWRNRATWLIAGLDLAQTVGFYTLSAWLPTYLHEFGWSAARVSLPYTLFEAGAIPGALLAPWLMERWFRRRPFMTIAAGIFLTGAVGLTLLPTRETLAWALMTGLTNSVAFAMSLALPAELAPADQVASMSGIVLTVAYMGAILGPPVAGGLRGATGVPAAGMIPVLAAGTGLVLASAAVPERRRRPDPAPPAAEGAMG